MLGEGLQLESTVRFATGEIVIHRNGYPVLLSEDATVIDEFPDMDPELRAWILENRGRNITPKADRTNSLPYTWHHHQETGRMQLVYFDLHDATQHLGVGGYVGDRALADFLARLRSDG